SNHSCLLFFRGWGFLPQFCPQPTLPQRQGQAYARHGNTTTPQGWDYQKVLQFGSHAGQQLGPGAEPNRPLPHYKRQGTTPHSCRANVALFSCTVVRQKAHAVSYENCRGMRSFFPFWSSLPRFSLPPAPRSVHQSRVRGSSPSLSAVCCRLSASLSTSHPITSHQYPC